MSASTHFRLERVAVPAGGELTHLQALADIADPYRADDDADGLFVAAMNEVNAWHSRRSPFFAALWSSAGSPLLEDIGELERLPFVHANYFKLHRTVSVATDDVVAELTSSGTTGQKSQMVFDRFTLFNGQRMVARIFDRNGWIASHADGPVNYLLSNYQARPGLKLGAAFTDEYLCGFAPVNSVEYALKHTGTRHEFDPFGCVQALVRFAEEGLPVRILGFPAFVSFTLDRMREMGVGPLALHPRSLVLFGGGWKGNADRQIPKAELYRRLHGQLGIPDGRIRDGYGAVEHSVPHLECAEHHLHVPVWARLMVRDVRTLEPLPDGAAGYPQFVSPYITSAPAQSVLMGDLVTRHPPHACACGLPTPWFEVHGRAGVSRNRSCAIAAAELLADRSA